MEESREVNEVSEQKIEQFYRPATADDVARVMKGETVEIRVRDANDEDWREGEHLGGFHRGNCDEFEWKDRDGVPWQQCQVYDPPAWYIDKPDPGEGWRLLEKFPHEDLQEGDEWYCFGDKAWHTSFNVLTNCSTQTDDLWYRRRIANNPTSSDSSNTSETPNSCRSRDTIPSGWRLLGKNEERLASDAYWSLGAKDWIIIGDDRVADANEFHKWHAIRQMDRATEFYLHDNCHYKLPSGQTIRVTAKGFEVV